MFVLTFKLSVLFSTFLLIYSTPVVSPRSTYVYTPDQYIHEEIPVGSLIFDSAEFLNIHYPKTVSSTMPATTTDMETLNNDQYFTFLDDSKTSNENIYFLLDSVTGRLTSKRYLDRESMCLNNHCINDCTDESPTNNGSCQVNVKILAIPSYKVLSMNLIVKDMNDNIPQFKQEFMTKSVTENLPVGYKVMLDLAYDPDAGQNSVQSYKLVETTQSIRDTFSLHFVAGSQLYLLVKKNIDRETVPQYNLTIVACDAGQPKNFCGRLQLLIEVIDQNDNSPRFDKSRFIFSVEENAQVGTIVGQVNAYDPDLGLNGKVTYTVQNGADSEQFFYLEQDTGILTLKKPIDYESNQFFSINIEARDNGAGSLPSYAKIEILVVDQNDNPPVIGFNFLDSIKRNRSEDNTTMLIYMPENTPGNTYISYVSVVDRDTNTKLNWTIYVNEKWMLDLSNESENAYLKLFKLNDNSFTLSTGPKSNVLFDREKHERINVSLKAADIDKEMHSTSTWYNFSIVLIDENDNAPKFVQFTDGCRLSVSENNKIDQIIFQFDAKDIDANRNGQVVYTLESVDSKQDLDFVKIDSTNGDLKASKVFDREEQNLYEFFVIARDSPLLISAQQVTKIKCSVKIIDENDNQPSISYSNVVNEILQVKHSNSTNLVLRLDENTPAMTKLVKFSCTDLDAENNAKTELQVANSQHFGLNEKNELYVLENNLDREMRDIFDFEILCQDNGREIQMRTVLKVRLHLNDVNDNCAYNLNASRNTVESQFVKINDVNPENPIMARFYTDADYSMKNTELSFYLETNTDNFRLNKVKAAEKIFKLEVFLKSTSVKMGKYVLKVRISDMGNEPCVKYDLYIIYLADNSTENELDLIEKSRINDQELYTYDIYDVEMFLNNSGMPSSDTNKNQLIHITGINKILFGFNSFGSNKLGGKMSTSFLVTFIFIISILLVSIIILFSVLVFLCKSLHRKFKKSKSHESIKVRNYSQTELDNSGGGTASSRINSSSSSSSSSDTNSDSGIMPNGFGESAAEIKNLLEKKAIAGDEDADASDLGRNNRRLSLSLNSQEHGDSVGDSAMSSLLYTRDFSSTSSQDENILQVPVCSSNFTILNQRYSTNLGANNTLKRTSAHPIQVKYLIHLI